MDLVLLGLEVKNSIFNDSGCINPPSCEHPIIAAID
jgi:hypothetical protein